MRSALPETLAPMRVSIVSINYAPEQTGIGVYTTGMAEYLAERGAAVTVHTGFPYYPAWTKRAGDVWRWFRREAANGVTLRRSFLYVPARPNTLRRILHELSFVATATLGYLRAPRSDCTIIVSPPLALGLPVAFIAWLRGSRVVFHVQDLQPDTAAELGMLKRGPLMRALYALERRTYHAVDAVSTISEGMRARILEKGIDPDKVFVFRNWANDNTVLPMAKSTRFRTAWDLDGKFVVLYSGNMGVKQGLGSVITAAALLKDDPAVMFVIVGEGGERQRLIERTRELGLANVLFQPLQPVTHLSALLATADVSIIPQRRSDKEIVLPSKLGNVLCSARPVIVAAAPESELGSVITAADCGLLVEPEDATQLAAAIWRLAHSPAECERFGRNGRAYMEAHLGHRAILEAFAERLVGLVREPRSGQPALHPVDR